MELLTIFAFILGFFAVIGHFYLAWSLQAVWKILKEHRMDKSSQKAETNRHCK